MSPSEWIAEARKHVNGPEAGGDPLAGPARRALIQLHTLVRGAPNDVRLLFNRLTEETLARQGRLHLERIEVGDLSWSAPSDGTAVDGWILAVAAQIRALDEAVMTLGARHFGPPGSVASWYVPEEGVYLVPRKRQARFGARGRDRQPFSRRGLLHHRILPAVTRGYRVNLVLNETIPPSTAAGTAGMTVGAALFEDVSLDIDRGDGTFTVRGISCRDAVGTVERQITAAFKEGACVVVWPELTVPPMLRDSMVRILRGRIHDASPSMSLQIVVAGTWHEKGPNGLANVATVLDGYGEIRLRYEKSLPYDDRCYGREEIAPGMDLPVLVTDDLLVAFAICRDYCELTVELPYPELDVDLVLVPSMGNDATMTGHRQTAKKVRVLYGARTFVVQQDDPEHSHPGALGLVLPIPDDPTDISLDDLRQSTEWKSYNG